MEVELLVLGIITFIVLMFGLSSLGLVYFSHQVHKMKDVKAGNFSELRMRNDVISVLKRRGALTTTQLAHEISLRGPEERLLLNRVLLRMEEQGRLSQSAVKEGMIGTTVQQVWELRSRRL